MSAHSLRPRGTAFILAVWCVAATSGAWAGVSAYDPEGLSEVGRERVEAVCRNVIGLSKGETHFYACMDSLSASSVALDKGSNLVRARDLCAGHKPALDRVALAKCELDASERPPEPEERAASPVARTALRSYFLIPPREVSQRERRACAEIGVEPASPAFPECVHGLDTALFDADYPSL